MHTNYRTSPAEMIYSKYMMHNLIYSCYTNLGASEAIFTWHESWHYYWSDTWYYRLMYPGLETDHVST